MNTNTLTWQEKIPFILALLTMIGGVFISILFGANEEMFKNKIKQQLTQNTSIQKLAEPDKKKKFDSEFDKNWRYYQRFHFHATGIGAMGMATLLLLIFLVQPTILRKIASYFIAVGGFLYPFVWLFAAMWGPEIGRDAAKQKFEVFGFMGGVFLLGLLLALIEFIRKPAEKK